MATVDDDGPGMPPENLETVFERFYTARPKGAAFGGNSGPRPLDRPPDRRGARRHASGPRTATTRPRAASPGARFIVDRPRRGRRVILPRRPDRALRLGGRWRGVLIGAPPAPARATWRCARWTRGFRLVADDRVLVWPRGGRLFGRAPDPLRRPDRGARPRRRRRAARSRSPRSCSSVRCVDAARRSNACPSRDAETIARTSRSRGSRSTRSKLGAREASPRLEHLGHSARNRRIKRALAAAGRRARDGDTR